MPNLGYESPSGDDSEHLLVMRGFTATMTEDGEAGVTVTFRIGDDANTAGDSVKVGIFNAAGTVLLAESAVRNDITVQNEYTFSGGDFTTFTPLDATTYSFGILANDSSVYVVFDNIASPGGIWIQDDDLSVFGPPMAFAGTLTPNDTKSPIGFMTYTSAGAGTGPTITSVDTDDIITATQTAWDIAGTDFDTATVEIRQAAVAILQDVNSQDADSINCDTVFDAGVGPHLKYGAATLAVVNADLEEDEIPIDVLPPSGKDYVDLTTPDPVAANRITAIADLAAGDQLEWSNVVGGTEADVTINPDATFDCDVAVTSFDVRAWDEDDQTWGSSATQSVEDPSGDNVPDAFSLVAQTDVPLSTACISNTITVSGMDVGASAVVGISGGGGQYSKNGAAYTASAGTAENGDTFSVRLTSSASYSTLVSTTLDIGGVSDAFDVTTGANVAPVFIGPSISDMTFVANEAIVPRDFSARWTDTEARTFTVVGTLPLGLALSGAGVLSGTPTVVGLTTSLEIRASDGSLNTDSNSFSINIVMTLLADNTIEGPGIEGTGIEGPGIEGSGIGE